MSYEQEAGRTKRDWRREGKKGPLKCITGRIDGFEILECGHRRKMTHPSDWNSFRRHCKECPPVR